MSVTTSAMFERRQSQCPACLMQRGTPITVTVSTGNKSITYRCEKCGHEWTVHRTEQPARLL